MRHDNLPNPSKPLPPSASDQTRPALIRAALRLFGAKGYDGTSTREIAAAANANIGSIAYHFGGKEGLRAACASFIVDTIQAVASAGASGREHGAEGRGRGDRAAQRCAGAHGRLHRRAAGGRRDRAVRAARARASDLGARHASTTACSSRPTSGCARSGPTRPARTPRATAPRSPFSRMIGQVVYFRIGREAVMRRMGWRISARRRRPR